VRRVAFFVYLLLTADVVNSPPLWAVSK